MEQALEALEKKRETIQIGKRPVGADQPTYIIAEIGRGHVHNGKGLVEALIRLRQYDL